MVEVEQVFPHDQRHCLHVVFRKGRILQLGWSTHGSCIDCYRNWLDVAVLVLREMQGVRMNLKGPFLLPCLHQAAEGTLV